MKYLRFLLPLILIVGACKSAGHASDDHSHAHTHEAVFNRVIDFPDIPGYETLSCDFHIHTVFSDGSVWPDIRVQEAVKDGLDAIALSEHLEYQPHKNDIPHPDRNRSFEVAKEAAAKHDLIIVHAAEITRSMPPGHSNAVFIQDANKLMDEDPVEVFREAKRQGAFVFWNHPNWTSQRKNGIASLTDMHKQLIEEDLLHGIEVVNDLTYSDEALQIAIDENLTIIGTSDIHGLVDWQYKIPEGGHRPVCLVFSEERSEAGIKAGMEAGRTVAFFNELLIGKEIYLKPLLEASIQVKTASYIGSSQVAKVILENLSSAEFTLQNTSAYSFHAHGDVINLPAHGILELDVKTLEIKEDFNLSFQVLNGIFAPKQHPEISLLVKVNKK